MHCNNSRAFRTIVYRTVTKYICSVFVLKIVAAIKFIKMRGGRIWDIHCLKCKDNIPYFQSFEWLVRGPLMRFSDLEEEGELPLRGLLECYQLSILRKPESRTIGFIRFLCINLKISLNTWMVGEISSFTRYSGIHFVSYCCLNVFYFRRLRCVFDVYTSLNRGGWFHL